MEATLTELHRKTKDVLRPVSAGGKTVTVTEHGKAVARIVPAGKPRLLTMDILRGLARIPAAPRDKTPLPPAEVL
jgi:prevent-host-death family protein